MADAVVVGAGPNGLVCANMLADAGWEVVVLEAAASPGGAVSSSRYLGADSVADVCSAFYPLAAASPAIAELGLEDYGLRWVHAPAVVAHPLPDGRAAVLHRDVAETADSLERFSPGDGEAWRALCNLWGRVGEQLLRALFGSFPPVRAGIRLAGGLGPSEVLRFVRFAMLSARRLAEENFSGLGGPLLLVGSALHTDLAPESATSAFYGWLLTMLGHQFGFPVPEGGAGQLSAAMVRRLESRGGIVLCNDRVRQIVVRRGRAVGAVTASGNVVSARKAVLADVPATTLYGDLVHWDQLPGRLEEDVGRFQWDHSTVKLDWALRAPVPWRAHSVAGAGTVHLADSIDEMTQYCADIARQRVPGRPFVLVGQMTTSDPSRSAAGTEVLWAYTHVPRTVRGDAGDDGISGAWDESDREAIAARIEGRIEEHAPGFKSLITARHLMCPGDLEDHDANLVKGAINGGTSALHQQMCFRPVPGLGRPETPISGLYLASSSVHPGGGVHGACGANAAKAAKAADRMVGRLFTTPLIGASARLLRGY